MMNKLFRYAASLQNTGVHLARLGIVIVLLWIGGLKAFRYEAVGVVANSPVMSFFFKYDAPEYKKYMNKEGEYKQAPRVIFTHTLEHFSMKYSQMP